MNAFYKQIDIRWSDLDPNFHVLHSKYYDFGAYSRMSFLVEHGITPSLMHEHHIGPILFREECVFRKELRFGDMISINLKLAKINHDFSRWTIVHEIWKKEDILAAVITLDAAWMDTQLRKLTVPPEIFKTAFEAIPKTDNFELLTRK